MAIARVVDPRVAVVTATHDLVKGIDGVSGRATPDDLAKLSSAVSLIDPVADPVGAAAANRIQNLISFDSMVQSSEVQPIAESAQALLALSSRRMTAAKLLKADLEAKQVAPCTLEPKHVRLKVDLSNAATATADTEFDSTAFLTFGKDVPAHGTLAVHPDRLKIRAVTINGKAVDFEVKNGRLHFETGGARNVRIDYGLKAQMVVSNDAFGGGTGLMINNTDPNNVEILTLLWPYNTDQLFPSNPDPSLGVTAKIDVKSPEGFLTSATKEGHEVPSYDLAIRSSNNLRKIEGGTTDRGTKVNFLVYKNNPLATDAQYKESLRRLVIGLNEVERILGAAYPDGEINFQSTPGGGGGMEHQGIPFVYDGAVTDPSVVQKGLFYDPLHEAIHGYFGNGVKIGNWANFTVSEGFVEYLTHRANAAIMGRAAYDAEMDMSRLNLSRYLARDPASLVTPPLGDINQWFTNVPYDMGNWLLRMCEMQLGTPKFEELLREFYHTYNRHSATIDDWTQHLSQKTGKDFKGFYGAWGNISGVPIYEVSHKVTGTKVELRFAGMAEKIPTDANNALLSGQVPVMLKGAHGQCKVVNVAPDDGTYVNDARVIPIDAGFPVTDVIYDPDRTVLANFERATADRTAEQETGRASLKLFHFSDPADAQGPSQAA